MTLPDNKFSPRACKLLQHGTLPQWISFFREVGFCENRRNPERNLRDKKARLRQSVAQLTEESAGWMAFEARSLCRNPAGCYQVTCQECMFGFLREFLVGKQIAWCDKAMILHAGVPGVPSQPVDIDMRLWRRNTAEDQIRCRKQHHISYLEGIFGSFLPCMMVDLVLNELPEHGYDELQKTYLAWRKSWYAYKANPEGELASEIRRVGDVPGVKDALSMLNMWGDILNDHTLYIQGYYTELDMLGLYGLDPAVIEYLFSRRFEWEEEIESLEAFAGLVYSLFSPESIGMLRTILSHINACGLRLATAEHLDPTTQVDLQSVVGRFRQLFDRFRDTLCARYLEDAGASVSS